MRSRTTFHLSSLQHHFISFYVFGEWNRAQVLRNCLQVPVVPPKGEMKHYRPDRHDRSRRSGLVVRMMHIRSSLVLHRKMYTSISHPSLENTRPGLSRTCYCLLVFLVGKGVYVQGAYALKEGGRAGGKEGE